MNPKECLQITTDIVTPCRWNTKYFPNGIDGDCPLGQCVAKAVIGDDKALEKVFGGNYSTPLTTDEKELVFHAVCPGTWNPNGNNDPLGVYTKDKPFVDVEFDND